jgi:hypothetical protein
MGLMPRSQALRAVALAALALALPTAAHAQVQAPTGVAPTPPKPAPPKKPAPKKPAPKTGKHKRPKLHGNAARADAAYSAMQRGFYVAGSGLYRGAPYSFLWGFSQALAATIAMTRVPGLDRLYHHELHVRMQGLAGYWDPSPPAGYDGAVAPPLGTGGPKYYDDNAWVALQLLRLYGGRPAPWMVVRAQELFTLISNAWDSDPSHPCPGGVPFSSAPDNTDRNTVTTAPTAELAVQLYRLTHAEATAHTAVAYFTEQPLQAEPRFFVAVYLRNLLLLDSLRPDPSYRGAASGYASWAWKSVRQQNTGLFVFDPSSFQLLDQASMVEIYALLAAPPTTYF